VDRHRHRFDPDPDPTFRFNADPDRDPDPGPNLSFTHVGKSENLFLLCFVYTSASLRYIVLSIFSASQVSKLSIFWTVPYIEWFSGKKVFFSLTFG
jgi:hypothetical protein